MPGIPELMRPAPEFHPNEPFRFRPGRRSPPPPRFAGPRLRAARRLRAACYFVQPVCPEARVAQASASAASFTATIGV